MVKVVKTSLHKVIGKSRLSYEDLETVLIQIESIVNSRPLTFITTEEVCEPLTPSYLIYGERLISAINNEYIDDTAFDISSEQCSNRVKYIQKLFDHYWSRFRKEYLQELSEQQRYNQRKFKTDESLLLDDVVIIKDEINIQTIHCEINGDKDELLI